MMSNQAWHEQIHIIRETEQYLVAYKPAALPSVPLAKDANPQDTLLHKVAADYPEVLLPFGKQRWEGLTLHRLDTDTSGLVLFARTKEAFAMLQEFQDAGRFIKHYYAATIHKPPGVGFPEYSGRSIEDGTWHQIKSGFRSYGPSASSVRPLIDSATMTKRLYFTAVRQIGTNVSGHSVFECSLAQGFRHQIRCHLAWAGFPLIGDAVYSSDVSTTLLLVAHSFHFPDPKGSGSIEKIDVPEIPPWSEVES